MTIKQAVEFYAQSSCKREIKTPGGFVYEFEGNKVFSAKNCENGWLIQRFRADGKICFNRFLVI